MKIKRLLSLLLALGMLLTLLGNRRRCRFQRNL